MDWVAFSITSLIKGFLTMQSLSFLGSQTRLREIEYTHDPADWENCWFWYLLQSVIQELSYFSLGTKQL